MLTWVQVLQAHQCSFPCFTILNQIISRVKPWPEINLRTHGSCSFIRRLSLGAHNMIKRLSASQGRPRSRRILPERQPPIIFATLLPTAPSIQALTFQDLTYPLSTFQMIGICNIRSSSSFKPRTSRLGQF